MQTVVLDQWAWVKLAKAASGSPDRPEDRDALDVLRVGVEMGLCRVAVGSGHYIETMRRGNPGSRRHLGYVIAALTRGYRIRQLTGIVRDEVRATVATIFCNAPRLERPRVFGDGVEFAFGLDELTAHIEAFDGDRVRRLRQLSVDAGLPRDLLDAELLAGPPERLPTKDVAYPGREAGIGWAESRNHRLDEYMKAGGGADLAHRLSVCVGMIETFEYWEAACAEMQVDSAALMTGEAEGLELLLSACPAAWALVCLDEIALKYQRRFEANDFLDVVLLAGACAYADVVVMERTWTNMLAASAASPSATVVSSLGAIPELLVAA